MADTAKVTPKVTRHSLTLHFKRDGGDDKGGQIIILEIVLSEFQIFNFKDVAPNLNN